MIDMIKATNAISDIVQNRPLPLREFDQIYMKTGHMVLQATHVAEVFDGKRVIFIGDGDSIALSMAYLHHRKVIPYGPQKILVLDFDERIVRAVTRFAEREGLNELIEARLYNCLDPLPSDLIGAFQAFYTNPPWGASNGGESVVVFMQRGIEAMDDTGEGLIVIADDPEIAWTQEVLLVTQQQAHARRFYIQSMESQVHLYHLDDAPELRSCNLRIRRVMGEPACQASEAIADERREHFYGKDNKMRVRYVRERTLLEYGKAPEGTYQLEYLDDQS